MVDYPKVSLGVGAFILKDDALLLVERKHPRGLWAMAGGYVEQDERLDAALIREVKEETGLDVSVEGLLIVRNMPEYGRNDLFCVFLCHLIHPEQVPYVADDESLQVRFVPPSEFDSINLDRFERWFYPYYMSQRPQPMLLQTVLGYDHAKIFAT